MNLIDNAVRDHEAIDRTVESFHAIRMLRLSSTKDGVHPIVTLKGGLVI